MRLRYAALIVAFSVVVTGCHGSTNAIPPTGTASVARARITHDAALAASSQMQWWKNDIGPRYQWNANYGYCGEVSFISAGLYYGQYASQYDVRAAVSDAPQNTYRSQLLVGVNDQTAAANMHLSVAEWDTNTETSTDAFLAWVKQNVVLGRPVVIGIYMNQYLFYGTKNPKAGSDYDHIVPVIGVGSYNALTNPSYFANDEIYFSDNGEWGTSGPTGNQYFFEYEFANFEQSRTAANAHNGTVYSTAKDGSNFGVAVTGVTDESHETVPVRVTTNVNYEQPSIKDGTAVRPKPMPLVLTVTVSGLQPGASYNLYRYNSFASVPNGSFNANAASAYEKWTVQANSGDTYTMTEPIESDEIAAYRAVPVAAP